jgi:RluA family pseudouridine synthase
MGFETPVLYLDEALLAVNKPAGLLSLPDGYDPDAPHLRSLLEPVHGRLWIVHRLDRETSGVILLARSAAAHAALNTQFERRQVNKLYDALVYGSPSWENTTISLPLRVGVGRRKRTAVDPQNGKPAVTHLQVLERFQSCCLLQARLETGRTHQIRAHLTAVGHPLLGDSLYSLPVFSDSLLAGLMARPALHAGRLEFLHPVTGERLIVEASYSPDFAETLQKLRQNALFSRQS